MARFFGTPDGVRVGQQFIERNDLRAAHVHLPRQAGISGTASEGADSIVVSGGYIDDEDHGDWIIYTGHGGQKGSRARQSEDQSPDAPGNAGLITSMVQGYPVRVSRGSRGDPRFAPPAGYVYAGLFTVTSHWMEVGRHGYLIARYRLDRIAEQSALVLRTEPDADPAFGSAVVSRRIRDTAIARAVITLYAYKCQICGVAVSGFEGRLYAEGAHVKPLGRPHLGADRLDNLVCLCPNHHTQLDIGGLLILDDFRVVLHGAREPVGSIGFASSHVVDLENVRYHRQMWSGGAGATS